MFDWLRRLPVPDWIKAGVIGALLTTFVFSLLPALWWLDLLATPILTGWLTILLFDLPYRKAFTKGMLAGLFCSLARLVPSGIFYATNPSMAAEVAPLLSSLVAFNLIRVAIESIISGIVSRVIANRQYPGTSAARPAQVVSPTTMNWVTGKSLFWRCPQCSAILQKKNHTGNPGCCGICLLRSVQGIFLVFCGIWRPIRFARGRGRLPELWQNASGPCRGSLGQAMSSM